MKTEEVKNKITKIFVSVLGVEPDEIVETADLQNDFGMDSLDTVELIIELEKEFSISIPDDEAEEIKTVGDILNYLETKLIK